MSILSNINFTVRSLLSPLFQFISRTKYKKLISNSLILLPEGMHKSVIKAFYNKHNTFRKKNRDLAKKEVDKQTVKWLYDLVTKYHEQTEAFQLSLAQIKSIAHEVSQTVNMLQNNGNKSTAHLHAESVAARFGISTPKQANSPNTWRRLITAKALATRENLAFELGIIHKHVSPSCRQTYKMIQTDKVSHKSARKFSFRRSTSNPTQPLKYNPNKESAIIITRIRALYLLKEKEQLDVVMLTIRCPRSVHGITPAVDFVHNLIARIASLRYDYDIRIGGLTCVESHQSGRPHIHQCCFGTREQLLKLINLIEKLLQEMFPNHEPDLFHITWENSTKGQLAWYTAKYAIKRNDISRSSWYFTHSIKRINFFGIPEGYKWEPLENNTVNKVIAHEQYAINLYDYICNQGGLGLRRKDRHRLSIQ